MGSGRDDQVIAGRHGTADELVLLVDGVVEGARQVDNRVNRRDPEARKVDADDRARPPEQGRELASSLPNAEFRLVETGHSPVYEAPATVAAAVRDVLARTR